MFRAPYCPKNNMGNQRPLHKRTLVRAISREMSGGLCRSEKQPVRERNRRNAREWPFIREYGLGEAHRVATGTEAERYLAACPKLWKDLATVMLNTGACPGKLYGLRWENVPLNSCGGMMYVLKGKVKARRRLPSMVPAVYKALKARHEAQGRPFDGWVFPTGSASGRM